MGYELKPGSPKPPACDGENFDYLGHFRKSENLARGHNNTSDDEVSREEWARRAAELKRKNDTEAGAYVPPAKSEEVRPAPTGDLGRDINENISKWRKK